MAGAGGSSGLAQPATTAIRVEGAPHAVLACGGLPSRTDIPVCPLCSVPSSTAAAPRDLSFCALKGGTSGLQSRTNRSNIQSLGGTSLVDGVSFSLGPRCCPSCGCKIVGRSRRQGLIEKIILPFFFIRPYRCEECKERYLGLVHRQREKAPESAEQADHSATLTSPHAQ